MTHNLSRGFFNYFLFAPAHRTCYYWGMIATMERAYDQLTVRQRLFIDHWLECRNGSEAARRAGYSKASACAIATENLRKPTVKQAIAERIKEIGLDSRLTPERIKASIANLAYDETLKPDTRLKALELAGRAVPGTFEPLPSTGQTINFFTVLAKLASPTIVEPSLNSFPRPADVSTRPAVFVSPLPLVDAIYRVDSPEQVSPLASARVHSGAQPASSAECNPVAPPEVVNHPHDGVSDKNTDAPKNLWQKISGVAHDTTPIIDEAQTTFDVQHQNTTNADMVQVNLDEAQTTPPTTTEET